MLKVTTHRSVKTWAFILRNETNDRALGASVYLQSRLSLDKKGHDQSGHSWGLGALFYYRPYRFRRNIGRKVL